MVEEVLARAQDGELQAYLATITLGEALYVTERVAGLHAAQRVLAWTEQLPVSLVDVDRDLAVWAAHLRATTELGYADCFVVALAGRLNASLLSGDFDFRLAEGIVPLHWIRE